MGVGVIDLGQYLRVLLHRLPLIAALTLVGALLGLAFSLTQPTRWQSTARLLDLPTPANVTVGASSLAEGLNPAVNTLTLPPVATRSLAYITNGSLDIEELVRERMRGQLPGEYAEPGALVGRVRVQEVAGRPNVLEVVATIPENAALSRAVANAWADALVQYVNGIVGAGNFDPTQASRVIAEAREELAASENAIARFQETGRLTETASRLAGSSALLGDLSEQQNQIEQNVLVARSLQRQLNSGSGSSAYALPLYQLLLSTSSVQASDVGLDSLLAGSLAGANQARDGSGASGRGVVQPSGDRQQTNPVQLQITLDQIEALPLPRQRALLSGLTQSLEEGQEILRRRLAELEGDVSTLSASYTTASAQLTRLTTERDANEETYEQLTQLVNQERISSQIQGAKIKVVDRASEPVRAGLGGLLPPVLGGVLGLTLGVLAAFLLEFARRTRATGRTEDRQVAVPAATGGKSIFARREE